MADEQVGQKQQPVPAAAQAPAGPERVRLRHPLTGDVKEVDGTPDKLVPLMGEGYEQIREEKN